MINHVLKPCKVCVACRRHTILPANIIFELLCAPVRQVERGIRHDIVCPHGRVLVVKECIRRILAKVGFNATDGKVHLCQLPCGRVGILTINRDIVDISAMVLYKFCRLNKHTAAAAARVIHSSLKRLQHFYQCPHNAGRRKELAASLAFLFCKHRQAVFISASQNVLLAAVFDHFDVRKQVNDFAQPTFIQFRTRKIFRQDILQARVFFFDSAHCIVNYLTDFRVMCLCRNIAPTRTSRHKEDSLRCVLVTIFLKAITVCNQLIVLIFKTIRNIFQENKTKDDTLIL